MTEQEYSEALRLKALLHDPLFQREINNLREGLKSEFENAPADIAILSDIKYRQIALTSIISSLFNFELSIEFEERTKGDT